MIISLAHYNTFNENLICFICQSFNHNLNPSNLYYLCSAVITHQQRQATAKAKHKPESGVLGYFLWKEDAVVNITFARLELGKVQACTC